MSRLRFFAVALALWTVGALIGQATRTDDGSVIGPVIVGLVTAAALWFYANRGHRWPWIALAILLVVGAIGSLSTLDARMLLVALDGLAAYFLSRGWPRSDSN